jgi:3'(2'), 5'-bisphosphate nucleotidase
MNIHLEIAIKAALDAGKEILKVYETDFSVQVKEDQSPLTIADQNANAVINSYLEPTGIPIISEENKQLSYAERKNWKLCWMVDPLDGTKEFVKRNGEFTVNIALIKEGHPVLGVIFTPVTNELYFTNGEEKGAFKCLVEKGWSLSDIEINANMMIPATLQEPIKIVGSRSHMNDETKEFVAQLEETKKVEIVSKGSSLKFCLVAEGKAHMYPRFAPTMEWDTAAGHAICEAVGLSVIDQDTQKPLRYNKENLLNPFFLVKTV